MQKPPSIRVSVMLRVLPLLLLVASGCGRGKPGSIDAAIVPGADVVARFDLDAIRAAPIHAAMKQQEAGSPMPGFWKPFWTATGITQDDLSGMIIAVDLDPLDLSQPTPDSSLDTLQAVMALQLSKSITLDQLKAGIAAMDPMGQRQPTEVTVNDIPALKSEDGGLVCLQGDGRYIFLSPNEASLTEALDRFKKGRVEALSTSMDAAMQALPGTPQIRAVVVLTEELQAKLKDAYQKNQSKASADLGASMILGMTSPLMDLKSLGLGVSCAADLALNLGGVFNKPESALQMKSTLDMAVGMMMMAAQEQAQGQGNSLAQALKVTQSENLLNLSLTLTQADLNLLQTLKPPQGVNP